MRFLSLLFTPWLLCAAAGTAQAEPPAAPQPLRILFLGEPDTPRTEDFTDFLAARFAAVQVADRWHWDRSLLATTDVVVLDWPQPDGISKWMLAGDRTVVPQCPLGAREQWTLPTVMVGSAGLNVAWAWDVPGSFG